MMEYAKQLREVASQLDLLTAIFENTGRTFYRDEPSRILALLTEAERILDDLQYAYEYELGKPQTWSD